MVERSEGSGTHHPRSSLMAQDDATVSYGSLQQYWNERGYVRPSKDDTFANLCRRRSWVRDLIGVVWQSHCREVNTSLTCQTRDSQNANSECLDGSLSVPTTTTWMINSYLQYQMKYSILFWFVFVSIPLVLHRSNGQTMPCFASG